MRRFDLYGAHCGSAETVQALVGEKLDCQFRLHNSSYVGGDYYRCFGPPEAVRVINHVPDDEGYFAEDDFKMWPILVYVSDSTRWAEVDAALGELRELVRLRTETL